MSFQEVLRLANNEPWRFLCFALPAVIKGQVSEQGMLLLVCGVLAKLGFQTLGERVFARLDPAQAAQPGAKAIAASLAALPRDEIVSQRLVSICKANLGVLRHRAVAKQGVVHLPSEKELSAALDAWTQTLASRHVYRGNSGHLIVTTDPDQHHMHDASVAELIVDTRGREDDAVYLVGVNSAAMLQGVHQTHPTRALGMQTRIVLVQPDLPAFLDAISTEPLEPVLAASRLDVLLGPCALGTLSELLHARRSHSISGRVIGQGPLGDQVTTLLRTTLDAQTAETRALADELVKRDASRDAAWWAERWREPGTRPLSALLVTTRYSTFVKHSTADLAAALAAAGCHTHVLIEPDDATRYTNLEFLRVAASMDPDLVFCINHQRAGVCGSVLTGVPFVCFIQDRMPQLFTTQAGRSQGERDFIAGHLHPELFERFSYPRRNTLMSPVPVCEEKFANPHITDEQRARHTCEIAYVSHQSGTPEALRDELRPRQPALVDRLYERLSEATCEGLIELEVGVMNDLCGEVLRQTLGQSPKPEQIAEVVGAVGLPMAERFLRQRMLAWAAELCTEHGWRMHLYGRGWDKHPTLAPFARGELGHNADLAASYHLARVHLHAGMGGVQHQRVMECALAGGCCAVRVKMHDARLLDWCVRNEIAAELQAAKGSPDAPVHIADHWQAMLLRSLQDRLGLAPTTDTYGHLVIPRHMRDQPWGEGRSPTTSVAGAWLVGDMAESAFWSRQTFRTLITSIVTSDARRESLSRWQRRVTREHFTYATFAAKMLASVRERMTSLPSE